jgi:RND family efflux transporter MFP subunit
MTPKAESNSSTAVKRFSGAWLLFALLVSTSTAFAQGPPPTLVVTEPVKTMEFHDQVTLVGRTEAKVKSRIVSEVSGRVTAVDAPEGNAIRKGNPLVTIDAEKIILALKAKEAEAAQAKAQADLAETNLKRIKELYAQKLIPETSRDSAEAWVKINQERYNQLDAQRGELAHDSANAVIRAPYTGYTLKKLVDVGEWVNPGTPVYEMVDLSQVQVNVDLPESLYGHLELGSSVSITLVNDSLKPVTGKVTGIARSASEQTHTFPVIITVRNSDGWMAGGQLVKATLSLNDKFESLAVSKDAIVRQGGQTFVYTIDDNKAVNVPVFTNSTLGNYIAISGEGIIEGKPVVVRGNERLFPGSPVTVANAATTAPEARDKLADSEKTATNDRN